MIPPCSRSVLVLLAQVAGEHGELALDALVRVPVVVGVERLHAVAGGGEDRGVDVAGVQPLPQQQADPGGGRHAQQGQHERERRHPTSARGAGRPRFRCGCRASRWRPPCPTRPWSPPCRTRPWPSPCLGRDGRGRSLPAGRAGRDRLLGRLLDRGSVQRLVGAPVAATGVGRRVRVPPRRRGRGGCPATRGRGLGRGPGAGRGRGVGRGRCSSGVSVIAASRSPDRGEDPAVVVAFCISTSMRYFTTCACSLALVCRVVWMTSRTVASSAFGAGDPGADDLGADDGLGVGDLLTTALELVHGLVAQVPHGRPAGPARCRRRGSGGRRT